MADKTLPWSANYARPDLSIIVLAMALLDRQTGAHFAATGRLRTRRVAFQDATRYDRDGHMFHHNAGI